MSDDDIREDEKNWDSQMEKFRSSALIIAEDLISSRTDLLKSYELSIDDVAKLVTMLVIPSSAKELDSLGMDEVRYQYASIIWSYSIRRL